MYTSFLALALFFTCIGMASAFFFLFSLPFFFLLVSFLGGGIRFRFFLYSFFLSVLSFLVFLLKAGRLGEDV